MPERRAYFRFEMKRPTEVRTDRLMIRAGAQHMTLCVASANRAYQGAQHALHWLSHLDAVEESLRQRDLIADLDAATAEQVKRAEARRHLEAAFTLIEELRTKKIEESIAFEERWDPFFTDPKNPVRRKRRNKFDPKSGEKPDLDTVLPPSVIVAEEAKAVPKVDPMPTEPVIDKQKPTESAPPKPPQLKLDPDLLRKAKAEAIRKAKSQKMPES